MASIEIRVCVPGATVEVTQELDDGARSWGNEELVAGENMVVEFDKSVAKARAMLVASLADYSEGIG